MTSPSRIQPATSGQATVLWRDVWLPALLFVLTLATTTATGVRYMHNFRLGLAPINGDSAILPYRWFLHHLDNFPSGLPFSVTLLLILLAHEFGHYFACRHFGVSATLPYVLPAPSLSGTLGAVIRLRSQVQSRAALLVIGAAGPIAGFTVALASIVIGLTHSVSTPALIDQGIRSPLLISGMYRLLSHLGVALPLWIILCHIRCWWPVGSAY